MGNEASVSRVVPDQVVSIEPDKRVTFGMAWNNAFQSVVFDTESFTGGNQKTYFFDPSQNKYFSKLTMSASPEAITLINQGISVNSHIELYGYNSNFEIIAHENDIISFQALPEGQTTREIDIYYGGHKCDNLNNNCKGGSTHQTFINPASLPCTNATFGKDPAPDVPKQCGVSMGAVYKIMQWPAYAKLTFSDEAQPY